MRAWDIFIWVRIETIVGIGEHDVKSSYSITDGEFRDQMKEY
jgi:hypothetical protein